MRRGGMGTTYYLITVLEPEFSSDGDLLLVDTEHAAQYPVLGLSNQVRMPRANLKTDGFVSLVSVSRSA